MKLTEYLQSYYGLSREDFNKLPKRAKSVLRQYHATYNQNLQKFNKPADYKYKVPMSLDHLLEICKRPVPVLTKEECEKLETEYNDLLNDLTSKFVDDVTEKIEDIDLDSLSLSAQIYVPKSYVPYWYDENYEYVDLSSTNGLKKFVKYELDNQLEKCNAEDIGLMDPDTTSWPLYLDVPDYGSIDPESLFITDGYGGNFSDDYLNYLTEEVLSPKHFNVPLKLYFYKELDDLTQRELETPENFVNKITQWLKDHPDKSLYDEDAPYNLADRMFEWMCDADNYSDYDGELYDVITEKIADLWNERYYPRAKTLLEMQDKQSNNVED